MIIIKNIFCIKIDLQPDIANKNKQFDQNSCKLIVSIKKACFIEPLSSFAKSVWQFQKRFRYSRGEQL